MSAVAPPSSPDPGSSRAVAPSAPAAMPSAPRAPPAAADSQVRLPSPPVKVRMLFPYAVSSVFGPCMRRTMALLGFHIFICVVRVVSFTTDAEEARFLIPIFRVWLYLGLATIVLMACVDIRNYMCVDRVCAVKFDPPQQPAAAAAVQLPPPPPEMDLC